MEMMRDGTFRETVDDRDKETDRDQSSSDGVGEQRILGAMRVGVCDLRANANKMLSAVPF